VREPDVKPASPPDAMQHDASKALASSADRDATASIWLATDRNLVSTRLPHSFRASEIVNSVHAEGRRGEECSVQGGRVQGV